MRVRAGCTERKDLQRRSVAGISLCGGAGTFLADKCDQLIRCHDGNACSAAIGKMARIPGDEGIDPTMCRHLEKRLIIRIWRAMGQGARRGQFGRRAQELHQHCDVLGIERKVRATQDLFILS